MKENIKKNSITDILEALGDKPQADELYIYISTESISENPFPYPFRTDSYSIMIILSGSAKIQFNLMDYTLQTNDIVLISPHTVTHIMEIEESMSVISITFTLNFALTHSINRNDLNAFEFFASKTALNLGLKKEEIKELVKLTHLLHEKNTTESRFYGKELLVHSFNLLMYQVAAVYRERYDENIIKMTRKEEITSKFIKLLEKNFKQQRKVQFYSDTLHMTAGHLSKILKEVSGRTTGELIDAAIITEACILLANPTLSISEISDELNFSDQSFFGKFFKKHTRLSPSEYRRKT
ncbi:AraC family transcriptional regulator [Flavobacterium salmonis]|uniref:AraC family transcriptional regulator n=1 Tax=Flavobacterium salmonis TaxID=2654844 RepID=A0A6V6Z6J5_9FLAO|nr:helix-turn-helix domain-containing protein [Flavobacterium salmonis]CAD0007219.1 AraC family transcriptional regulator [Flavobacterium salmonis]